MEGADRRGPALQLREGDVVIDRYKVVKRLGTGGTGTVYLAHDSFLEDEPIAIKMLHPHLNRDEKHTKRFVREVLLTRQVTHPNVVRTFDVATQDDNLFYTMEYASGSALTRSMRNGPLPLKDGIGIFVEICKGLSAIHDAGVIHRDLKPGNVILTDTMEVKISDFGIARHEEHSVTTSSEVVGSCHYISPEVWRGEVNAPTVDIYSLGVMAYEMFTGVRMFAGETIHELMYKHCQTEPMPPLLINEEVPSWLNDIILAMVDKNAALRPQSARQIGLTIEEEYKADCEEQTQVFAINAERLQDLQEHDAQQYVQEPTDTVDPEIQKRVVIQSAGEELLKSWATKQEKLNSIEFLESLNSPDSVDYLIKAVERYHPDDIDLEPHTDWPVTGAVAARAARALGRSGHEKGITFLIGLLNNKSKAKTLRESACYGLAAGNSDRVLAALRTAFLEEHGKFRRSILLAIQDSIKPLGKSKRQPVQQILLSIVKFTIDHPNPENELQNEILQICQSMIKRHRTTALEEHLMSVITNSNDLPNCLQALHLLKGGKNPKINRGLAELLRDEVLPEEFSIAIGNTLKDSQNALVLKVAQEIIEHNNVVQNLFSSLSLSKHRKLRSRRIAAKIILGQELLPDEQ